MKRMSVTLNDEVIATVDALGHDSKIRAVVEDWLRGKGLNPDLTSESARLRAMLDIADVTLRGWALEVGYEQMATWHNERAAAERPEMAARRARSAAQWAREGWAREGAE